MNILWQRLVDGMIQTLERNVAPGLEDAYARGQLFGVIGVLAQIRAEGEWKRQVLRDQVNARAALFRDIERQASAAGITLPQSDPKLLMTASEDGDLFALRAAGDEHIYALLRALEAPGSAELAQTVAQLRSMLHEQIQALLGLEARHVIKPEFAQVTSGQGEGSAQSRRHTQ